MIEIHEDQSSDDDACNRWVDMMKRILLGGIGAAALARDVPEDFVYRLVRCGRISKDIGHELILNLERRETPDIRLARSLLFVPADSLGHTAEKRRD